MALINCKECKKEVSKKAKVCPHCGVKEPGTKLSELIGGFVMLAIIITGCVFWFGGEDEEGSPKEKVVVEVPQAKKVWYEGGSLHSKNALEWQKATASNKLATCADIVYTMKNRGVLNDKIASSISTVDDLKPYATELKNALDESFKTLPNKQENINTYQNQQVTDTSVIMVALMGWAK